MNRPKRALNQYLSVRVFAMILVFVLVPCFLVLKSVQNNMMEIMNREISSRIVQNFAPSEDELERIFAKMATISTYIINDSNLIQAFKNKGNGYLERTLAFRDTLGQINQLDLYEYEDIREQYEQNHGIRVILVDNEKRIYTSWGYNRGMDLDDLINSSIVSQAKQRKGFIFWEIDAPPIGLANGTQEAQTALARALFDLSSLSDDFGYMVVTIDQQFLFSILNRYKNSDSDIIFAVLDDGTVLRDSTCATLSIPPSVFDGANTLAPVYIDKKPFLVSKYCIDKSNFFDTGKLDVYCLTDYETVLTENRQQTSHIHFAVIICTAAIGLIALWVAWQIARPVNRLTSFINSNTPGTIPKPIPTKRKDEIGMIYQAYNHMNEQNYQLIERIKDEKKIQEKYYLESLKSKISPHFLFNTLNSIRWMAVIRNAQNIQQSIDALASILKYSLSDDSEMVALSQEMKIVEDYCYIQETRFGCTCRLREEIPNDLLPCKVIKFILQPVVENCFKHAFTNKEENNRIAIRAWEQNNKLWISISDSGIGFPEEMIQHFQSDESRKEHLNHLGIHIVDERIRIAYGGEYGLSLSNNPDGGACVLYCLPVVLEGKNEADNDR